MDINDIIEVANSSLQKNSKFIKQNIGFSKAIILKEFDSPDLREFMLNLDSYMARKSDQILKDSRTTKATLDTFNDKPIFIKRYNNKGIVFTIRHCFRHSRAFRAWKSAWVLKAIGIPTPTNLSVISFRKFIFLTQAYLITEAIPNLVDVADILKKINIEGVKESLVEKTTEILAKIHNHNFIHGDLKLSNFYITKNDEEEIWGLWDLDGSCFKGDKELTEGEIIKEVARLVSSYFLWLNKLDIEFNREDDMKMFVDHYNKLSEKKVALKQIGFAVEKRYKV